ncbi:radical SAM protein [Nonomuraea sp. NPDC052265]|uniref:radical SAM protein n=1 Tax=Nonomuraea sp. NPDC052265 TaxID=3364374 RepID=UPI0037C9CEA2
MNNSVTTPTARYKPSRFNLVSWDDKTGQRRLLIYNTMTSAFVRLAQPAADRVSLLLKSGTPAAADAIIGALATQGVLVPEDLDELLLVDSMERYYKQRRDALQLILMPTEKCNFRCVYCYEDFVKGKMSDEVRSGIVRLVEREAPHLKTLNVAWFGGEPLSALGVIREVSAELIALCDANGIEYSSSMTTNGFLLSSGVAEETLGLRISRYQITLDGTASSHDQLRVLRNGRGTFDTIVANLTALRESRHDFKVRIRVNFTPQVAQEMPGFLAFMGERFGNDPRFSIWFHPVGRWGGPHDEDIETCDQQSAEELERGFTGAAADSGFPLTSWEQLMRPFGSTCYAADPRSYVIGSDGMVYKCTVALREPKNHVGQLSSDGDLRLREDRMAVWVSSGAQVDTGCQACAFRPACHGDACPLARLQRGGERSCPPIKSNIKKVLPLIAVRAGRQR